MNPGVAIREARARAGLSQEALAERAGTSQATVSAYENGRKRPSLETLERLLAAAGARLAVEHGASPRRAPSAAEQRRAGRRLLEVIELAEHLPTRHDPELRFPRLRPRAG